MVFKGLQGDVIRDRIKWILIVPVSKDTGEESKVNKRAATGHVLLADDPDVLCRLPRMRTAATYYRLRLPNASDFAFELAFDLLVLLVPFFEDLQRVKRATAFATLVGTAVAVAPIFFGALEGVVPADLAGRVRNLAAIGWMAAFALAV